MKAKLKLLIFIPLAAFAFLFFARESQNQQKLETASQKFKSIKVLGDMPADQMGKVMNMMSSSLGVDCKFCHASNDGDYEKEGNEHKDMARQMLTMTFELNKKYFNGRPEINCNTCHKGIAHPQPSFPLAPQAAEPRPKQPEKKPTMEEILAKYELALGGKTKLNKVISRHIKAQRIEPDGKTTEAEEIWQKPGKILIQTSYPSKDGNYLIKEGFDGKTAWKTGNDSAIILKPDEADAIKREAELFANPDIKALYSKLEYRFLDKLDGREAYMLIGTNAANQRERLYFDAQSGLLVRRAMGTQTILGMHVFQVDYADYKDFGGVKLPTAIKYAMPQIYWTRKILEVKNNIAFDDAKFGGK